MVLPPKWSMHLRCLFKNDSEPTYSKVHDSKGLGIKMALSIEPTQPIDAKTCAMVSKECLPTLRIASFSQKKRKEKKGN